MDNHKILGRREILTGASAFGLSSLLSGSASAASQPEPAALVGPMGMPSPLVASSVLQSSCTVTGSDIEGPFHLPLNLLRQDITEGKPGLPVTLIFQVIDGNTCRPVDGAIVDIWQDDALGAYSGFSSEGTGGETWLRGIQVAGASGLVFFNTIFPGWYAGRTTHWHAKVIVNGTTMVTTQFYMKQFVSDFVYQNIAPYDTRGASPTKNPQDNWYDASRELAWLRNPNGSTSIWAGIQIVVA